MRQIGLTFAGEPRTHAAAVATQEDWRMNLPLAVLAFFALVAGYVGVHEDFPVLGRALGGNFFHRFIGSTLLEEPGKLPLDYVPLLLSIVIALSGLFVGWLIYVRRPLEAGEEDPLARFLGAFYTLFENKYYLDELYDLLFVRPSQWFAQNVAYLLIDRGIIDGVLHFIARSTQWLALRNKDFDTYVVNGGPDELVSGIGELSDSFKYVQSGRVQQYLTVAVVGVLMLAGVFVWTLFLR
jgi:NADH-quinone oxidoreductase subunit L